MVIRKLEEETASAKEECERASEARIRWAMVPEGGADGSVCCISALQLKPN